jgi:hypothetical protein
VSTESESEAIALLEEALHIRQNGERAPGHTENWRDWDVKAERFLRAHQGTDEGAGAA